jgi:predicted RND superfamily exporter protein
MVYRSYTDIYKSFDKFMEINGGSVPVFGLIKTENNILSGENANIILNYQKELEEKEAVSKTMSVYDLYSTLNQRLFGKKQPEYPNNQLQIMLINNVLKQAPTNPVNNFLAENSNVSRMIIFPKSLKNEDLKTIQQITNKFERDSNIKIDVTGVQYLMYDLNQSMIKNQTGSLIIAFSLILLLLFITLKKIIPALVSLIPIVATVIILFGFLAVSGISLNLITTTIFSITLGVGIDYAVHFTSVWKGYKEKGFTSKEAADKAYKYTSRPIIANAFGLAIGLSAMLLSPLQIHVYVSTMMWVSMITAVFLSLSVLPTILRKIK